MVTSNVVTFTVLFEVSTDYIFATLFENSFSQNPQNIFFAALVEFFLLLLLVLEDTPPNSLFFTALVEFVLLHPQNSFYDIHLRGGRETADKRENLESLIFLLALHRGFNQ
jgi:hypothetical protein